MGMGDIGNYMDENRRGGRIDDEGFFDVPEMDIEETREVPRQAKKQVWNWKRTFARELMSGSRRETISRKYAHLIKRFDISAKANKYLADNEHMLGHLFIDQNYFDDTFNYSNVPDSMKLTNLFSIGSLESETLEEVSKCSTNDGSMDGFLASSDSSSKLCMTIDKKSGLPVFNSVADIDFNVLDYDRVAKVLLNNRDITLAEYNRFANVDNKFQYLARKIRKAMTPQSLSSGEIDQTFTEYGLRSQQIDGQAMPAVAGINVDPQGVRMNDIGKIKETQRADVDINEMLDKRADKNTVPLDRRTRSIDVSGGVDGTREYLDNISTAEGKRVAFDDDELASMKNKHDGASAYLNKSIVKNSRKSNDCGEIELSLKDSDGVDDYFNNIDVGKSDNVDFDDDELNNLNADRNELDIDDVVDDIKISNKYEFGW